MLRSPLLPDLQRHRCRWCRCTGSDSQSLDNMLEVLLLGGLDVPHALRLLIPPAWQAVDTLDADLRAFYEYYSAHMEPWDGPAGVVLTDGRYAACTLDRNGLRPARFVITKNRHLTIASETGRLGLRARRCGAQGQARTRRDRGAGSADRHAARDARCRCDA